MIEVDHTGAVAVLRLNHGKVNALDLELLSVLAERLAEIEASGARAVVLTGAGRVFSAGVDLFRVLDGGPGYAAQLIPALASAFDALFGLSLPVVAAVNGAAIAGGAILTAATDRRLMVDGDARIGASELMVGVPFPVSALEILRHACGPSADEVALTGTLYRSTEALRVGLVHEVVPAEQLVERALQVAEELGAIPSEAYARTKEQLHRPTRDRIAALAANDGEVARVWSLPETAASIRAHLDRAVTRKS